MKYPQMLATMVKCTICYSCGANGFLFQGAAIMALPDVNGHDVIHRRGKTTKRLGVSLPDSFYAVCIHSFRVSGELTTLFSRCNYFVPSSLPATPPIGRSHYLIESVVHSLLYPLFRSTHMRVYSPVTCSINVSPPTYGSTVIAAPSILSHPTHVYSFVTCGR